MELENSLFVGADCSRERLGLNQRKQVCFCSQYLWNNFFSFLLFIIELLLMFFCEFLTDVWLRKTVKKECFVVSQFWITIHKKKTLCKEHFFLDVRTLIKCHFGGFRQSLDLYFVFFSST